MLENLEPEELHRVLEQFQTEMSGAGSGMRLAAGEAVPLRELSVGFRRTAAVLRLAERRNQSPLVLRRAEHGEAADFGQRYQGSGGIPPGGPGPAGILRPRERYAFCGNSGALSFLRRKRTEGGGRDVRTPKYRQLPDQPYKENTGKRSEQHGREDGADARLSDQGRALIQGAPRPFCAS